MAVLSDYEFQLSTKKTGATNPIGYMSDSVTSETAAEASVQYMSLAGNSGSTAIPFGGVTTASLIALTADGDGLTIALPASFGFRSILIFGAEMDAADGVAVTNTGSQQVNVQALIVGE